MNPVIFNLRLSELWHLNPTCAQNPFKDFRSIFLARKVKNYNYFSEALHRRSLTGFWIQLSLNKYLLTVTSRYVLYKTYSELLVVENSGIFRSIHVLFRHTQSYLGIFRTLCKSWNSESYHIQNPGIFRTQDIFKTLSRHILAYSERCVMLAYWEPCHIQNFDMFRILAYLGTETYSKSVYLGTFRYIQTYSRLIIIIFFLSSILHTFQRNLKDAFFDCSGVNFNPRLSLLT